MAVETEEQRKTRKRMASSVITLRNADGSLKEIPGEEPPSQEVLDARRDFRERAWQIIEEIGAAQG